MSNYRYLNLQVHGADATETCAAVAELCSSPEPLESSEPEECAVEYQSQGSQYCDYSLLCTQPVEAGDIKAELTRRKYANCYPDENGRLMCSCSDESVYRTYLIEGVGPERSCQLAMDLCESGDDVVFDEAPTCETIYSDASREFCNTEWQCLQSANVQEGVTALVSDWQHASCYQVDDSTVSCDCSGNQSYMRFSTAGTVDANTCGTAREVCSSEDQLLLSGPITCKPSNQSRGGDRSCFAYLECSQEGLFDRQELLAYGEVSIDCRMDASGAPWDCTCRSGTEMTSLELEAADEWEACTLAAERCPDAVEVQIGSVDYGYYPPMGPVPLY